MKKFSKNNFVLVTKDNLLHWYNDNFFGIEIGGRPRGFVSKKLIGGGAYFCALDGDDLTRGNTWSQFDDMHLDGCLKKLINNSGVKVFSFNDKKSLFAWLAGRTDYQKI